MAWTYSNWRSLTTTAARAARLALYIQEVEDKITADIAADGKSRGSHPLVALSDRLAKEYDGLIGATGAVSRVAFRKAR